MRITVTDVGEARVQHAEAGTGTPVVVLHGMGVDHREPVAALEPVLGARTGYRRLYPDLPGMGGTTAPASVASSDDVAALLADWLDATLGDAHVLLVGHSYGGYLARVLAGRHAGRVDGLALLCPAGARSRDVPAPVVLHEEPGADDGLDAAAAEQYHDYFVVRTTATRRRFDEAVESGSARLDVPALERVAGRWVLDETGLAPLEVPVLVVAGRQDSSVGYAAAWDLVERYPRATFAVLDRAGHALPHEQGPLLGALVDEWLDRVEEHRATR